MQKRVLELKIWNITGRPANYCDPPSWDFMPKFQKVVELIHQEWPNYASSSQYDGGKDPTILDIGCFTGYLLRHLKGVGHRYLTGVDIHKVLLEKLAEAEPMIKFHFGRAEDFDQHTTYDCIIMLDTLEHVFDDEKAVSNIRSQMWNDQSLFIVNVPLACEGYKDDALEHLRMYTEESLTDLLHRNKFGRVKRYPSVDEYGYDTLFLVARAV